MYICKKKETSWNEKHETNARHGFSWCANYFFWPTSKLISKDIFYKIHKILINKQKNAIILFKRFNLNGNIIGFCPRIRKLNKRNTSAAYHILGEYFKQQFFRSFLLTMVTTTFDQFLLYSIEKCSFESCLTNFGHILEIAGYYGKIVTCSTYP